VKSIKFLLIIGFAIIQIAYAQAGNENPSKGKISGKIFDKTNNEPLIGSVVLIEGTSIGTQTNFDGEYEINNLSPGTYKLIFKYVSYETKVVEGISVNAGKVTTLNMSLAENAVALKEVVVTSSFKKESLGAMYTMQKNNISISDGISSDLIKKSPDKNTSDVLKRVSGTSIQDNKFVVIRGLADRYNTATINNAMLPSSEPDKKAFSFDIIPSNLIDRITINKTASANLPADFAGGVIQVVTKDIPDENFLDFSTSWGFNTQSTFKKFISNGHTTSDYFGFSNGDRTLSGAFPSSRQKYAGASLANQLAATKTLKNSYAEQTSIALPSQSYQVTLGSKKDLKDNGSFGSITSLTYRNEQRINPSQRMDYDGPSAVYSYDNTQYKFSTNVGALANFTYVNGKNKFSFKNIYNRIYEENYLDRSGDNLNNLVSIKFNSNELTQKSLLNSQLEGSHTISANDAKLSWNLNYANISSSQPDLRTIFYNRPIDQTDAPYTLVDRNSRRFFSEMQESNFGGSVSVSIPYKVMDQKGSLKVGGLNLMKQRNFKARIFNYAKANFASSDSLLLLPKETIFSEENISANGFVLNEFTNNSDKYYATSMLNAAYIMLDQQIKSNVKLNVGVRMEMFNQNIDAVDATSSKIESNNTYVDVLPSLNFTYEINEKTNYRFSASKTVSRPEFRELAPFEFYDFITGTSLIGNPNLKRSENYNIDSRIEYYPSAGEAITFTGFYKQFKNPIEQIVNSSSNADLRRLSFDNAEKANTYGIELEFRKKLGFIEFSDIFDQITFYTNASLMYSKVYLSNQGGIERALQGQSPYLFNGGLQYTSKDGMFAASLLYNRVGHRIYTVGFQGYPDIYENSRNMMDIQLSRRVMKRKAEIKLNVSDIFNQSQIFYQNLDSKKSYSESSDRIISTMKFGTTISVGFSYNLPLL
jgi:outer membrane receptor protein involved in Fe transport